jgi:hypothetical protein
MGRHELSDDVCPHGEPEAVALTAKAGAVGSVEGFKTNIELYLGLGQT